tara:strand:- start:51 stop:284 length:234 start_codon:yes stop_codon:yes gene_type:complete
METPMTALQALEKYTSILSPNQWFGVSFILLILILACLIGLFKSETNRRILVVKTGQQDKDNKALREQQKASAVDTP